MGRPREFDETEVLDQALQVFWARGYEATSVAELVEATGLAKGSLYKAFGDKRSLFLRALDSYLERGVRALKAEAKASSPRQALRRWLLDVVEMSTCSGLRKGCMAVNCTVELGPHDDEVRERLRRQERAVERVYARLIREAIAAGEARAQTDPEAGARWLTTVVNGLQVRGKLGLDRKAALETVDMALSVL